MKRQVLDIADGGMATRALMVDEEGQVKGWSGTMLWNEDKN